MAPQRSFRHGNQLLFGKRCAAAPNEAVIHYCQIIAPVKTIIVSYFIAISCILIVPSDWACLRKRLNDADYLTRFVIISNFDHSEKS